MAPLRIPRKGCQTKGCSNQTVAVARPFGFQPEQREHEIIALEPLAHELVQNFNPNLCPSPFLMQILQRTRTRVGTTPAVAVHPASRELARPTHRSITRHKIPPYKLPAKSVTHHSTTMRFTPCITKLPSTTLLKQIFHTKSWNDAGYAVLPRLAILQCRVRCVRVIG